MRTDSTHVAASAITETRNYIKEKLGDSFLPAQPRQFDKKKKFAQEAHEAIRPTKVLREPDLCRPFLKADQMKLYDLIWKRMVASQMAAAIYSNQVVDVKAARLETKIDYLLRATSSLLKFPGFTSLYSEGKDEDTTEERFSAALALSKGDTLNKLDLIMEQNFTQPPPRYSEATLIKALEQKGIGRPSTYAPILSTIQDRGYVFKENGRFCPEEIGFIVNDLLTKHFTKIVDLNFTARMEKDLDEIAKGNKEWVTVLKNFYTPFDKTLATASDTIEKVHIVQESDELCPVHNIPMVIKTGRYGKFIACPLYPECKETKRFLIKTGVPCPECGQTEKGELVERVSKKKRRFWGCSRFPSCRYITNKEPLSRPCPSCGGMLVAYGKDGAQCTSCSYKGKQEDVEKVGVAP
jgi:DNA topoisomerase-1